MTYEEYILLRAIYGNIFLYEMLGLDAADCVMGRPHFNPYVLERYVMMNTRPVMPFKESFPIGICDYDFMRL